MTMLLTNGKIVTPDCSGFICGNILIKDDTISEIGNIETADKIIDANGSYILPGLVDIHNHGSIGVHYAELDSFGPALDFIASKGVTSILPTLGTNSIEALVPAIQNILEEKKRMTKTGASIEGIHLEGPFISSEKRGAMESPSPDCTFENFKRLIEAGEGEIKLMAIAPERENALDVIKEGVRLGVRMSLGHTNATYAEAMAGIEAGATHVTHVFNAMRSYNHREPGVLGAVLTEPSVMCETICDMVHLAPATVKLVHKTKGLDGMILISDSVRITGMPDGEYVVNGSKRIVKDGVSKTPTGTIAGSCFTMADGARRLVELGFSLADIARVGALNPARALGLDKKIGTLEKGKRADMIICDDRMNVERVILRGGELI